MATATTSNYRFYDTATGEAPLPPERAADRARVDLGLRIARVLLAAWWIVSPYLLAYAHSYPQRQDVLIGLVVLPFLALGIAMEGMRVVLLCAGVWLFCAPFWSGEYFLLHRAMWNDWITGVLAFGLGLFPLRPTQAWNRVYVLSTLSLRPRGWHRQRADLRLPERGIIPAPPEPGEPRPAMRHGAAVTAPEKVRVEPAEKPGAVEEPFPASGGAIEPQTAGRNARFAIPPQQENEDEPIPTVYPPLDGDIHAEP